MKRIKVWFWCYRVGQSQTPAMLAVNKNHKSTNGKLIALIAGAAYLVVTQSTWHFAQQCHWLSVSLITVLWIKKTEWTLLPHCPFS